MTGVLWRVAAGLLVLALFAGLQRENDSLAGAAGPVVIEVTSAAAGSGTCPDPAGCTLRRAIEVANADVSGNAVVIRFNGVAFPGAAPADIANTSAPLPVVTRANTTIDGTGAGVRIVSASPVLSGSTNGLVLGGDGDALKGLTLAGFTGACVVVQGANGIVGGDAGNRIGGCGTGILVTGAAATITGNRVGFAANDDPNPVAVGVQVNAGGATIGADAGGALANTIGNTTTGIRVGGSGGLAFSGAKVLRNTIGSDGQGHPAPATTAIDLRQPSSGTLVSKNDIANAATGISVAGDAGGASVTGNRFDQNLFHGITGMAIDLDANGVTNPNRAPDGHGANRDRNHPSITRATQSRITGTSDCTGCAVQLYVAEHHVGAAGDYGSAPVAGGAGTTDAAGNFSFDNPAVTPGQWVLALVTDGDGNTSEFGPSARVGSGLVQCGSVALSPGWNQAPFFGSDPLVLGASFPADAGGVRAIYRYDATSRQFAHWIAGGGPNTLTTLQPGEPYWFLADMALTLAGGFSLSAAAPASLKAGWNEVAYLGGTAEVSDALSSIAGAYRWAYHWANDGAAAGWQAHGDGSEPAWADGLTELRACQAYSIYATADVTLTPLQP